MSRFARLKPRAPVLVALFAALLAIVAVVDAQLPNAPDDRHAGLQWRFVRIKYHFASEGTRIPQDFYGDPWGIDAPAAEQNLTRRIKTATAIDVQDPILLTLDDPRLFQYPWIYFVEPSSMRMQEREIPLLREFLLRGGTAMMDDFHGPGEWDAFEREMKRLFPDRPIVEIPETDPLMHIFYDLDENTAIPGERHLRLGPGGQIVARMQGPPSWRGIYDDRGRLMVAVNFNIDMGDSWEHADDPYYPVPMTALGYKFGINYVIYAMTH